MKGATGALALAVALAPALSVACGQASGDSPVRGAPGDAGTMTSAPPPPTSADDAGHETSDASVPDAEALDASSADTSPPYVWSLPPGFPTPQVPTDNPMSDAKVELGRRLFYDTRLSGNQTYSCASCHDQHRAFTDGLARAVGSTGQIHPRSAMSLTNVAYAAVLTWPDPLITSLEQQAYLPMFNDTPVELGLEGQEGPLLARLGADPFYQALFPAAFPGDPSPVTVLSIERALASFERTLISGRSAYDRYVYGHDATAMSDSALRGMDVFFNDDTVACSECHAGFDFAGATTYVGKSLVSIDFHNTGLYNIGGTGAYPPDNTGLLAVTNVATDMGKFKVPTLRNLGFTAPYMHDGSATALSDVLAHYAAGGRTITSGPYAGDGHDSPYKDGLIAGFQLTDQQTEDLTSFLLSLDDPAFVSDPRLANPWE